MEPQTDEDLPKMCEETRYYKFGTYVIQFCKLHIFRS